MKITLVRIVGSKDPAMIVFGHPMQKSENAVNFFWQIDECCDPSQCEYLETEIIENEISIFWSRKNQFPMGADLSENATAIFAEMFDGDDKIWIRIQPDLSGTYVNNNHEVQ